MQNLNDQPKQFDEALANFLNDGHGVDRSIELAAEAYPELYRSYIDELRHP